MDDDVSSSYQNGQTFPHHNDVDPETNVLVTGVDAIQNGHSHQRLLSDVTELDNSQHTSGSTGQAAVNKVKFTLRQKLTFVGVALTFLTTWMSFSVLAPFFPVVAENKGVTQTEIGLIFGAFAVANFTGNIIFGKYLSVIGAKFAFLSGSIVSATCNIIFGVLKKIEQKKIFIAYCFIVRVFEALGVAACVTSGSAVIANTFPDNIGQMAGLVEIAVGLGFTIGPLLGSVLYQIGGFGLPFFVLGGVSILVAVANVFILPPVGQSRNREETGSVLRVGLIPAVFVVCLASVVGMASQGFNGPTLESHVTKAPFSLSPSFVGIMFLIRGGTYAVAAPFWGYIADKKKLSRMLMIMGGYFMGLAYMFVGPSPLLNLPSQTWILVMAQGMMGVGAAAILVPPFIDILVTAKWFNLPDDITTQAIASGLVHGAYSTGNFIGPVAGGALVDVIGYNWATTVMAGCNFLMMISLALFSAWEYQYGRGRRKPMPAAGRRQYDSGEDAKERRHLIQNE